MLLATQNITLENVKKSNYWDLIAHIVWNHYSESKFQDESMVEIKEDWCGVSHNKSSKSMGSQWDNPEYIEDGYIRTLNSIEIIFKRSDYTTWINIMINDGSVHYFTIYNDKSNHSTPQFYPNNIDVVNWCISNGFLTFKS